MQEAIKIVTEQLASLTEQEHYWCERQFDLSITAKQRREAKYSFDKCVTRSCAVETVLEKLAGVK